MELDRYGEGAVMVWGGISYEVPPDLYVIH